VRSGEWCISSFLNVKIVHFEFPQCESGEW